MAQRDFLQQLGRIQAVLQKTIFFVGGAPRSGTTWVQEILNAHPQIACRSEALIQRSFQDPIEEMLARHGREIAAKNQRIFAGKPGYPLPTGDDADLLLGVATLMTLARQSDAPNLLAIGEKTPENVFFFPRLKSLFPSAKLIVVVRDPRDVLASAWHFFGKARFPDPGVPELTTFIQSALPSIESGLRATVDLQGRFLGDVHVVAYEQLIDAPFPAIRAMFQLLGVSATESDVQTSIEAARFPAARGGEQERREESGAFLRLGVKGSWGSTLSPQHEATILERLAWSFDVFGWSR